MRIQCDSLKYARLLGKKGVKSGAAEGFMSTLTQIEIFNLYSKHEVNSMLSESVEKVFAKQDEKLVKQDLKLAEQKREFDVRMQDFAKYHDQQLRDNKSELLASRRWMIGTVITVGLSLAAYLSALLHFNH
ncbi:MAG: hypothetical protein H0U57_13520 [Tatlockia sp.]|nr:hypothetical protein [Tatlockia sp.]